METFNEKYHEIVEEKKELIDQSFRDSVATIIRKAKEISYSLKNQRVNCIAGELLFL